jgi:hypothetical protein
LSRRPEPGGENVKSRPAFPHKPNRVTIMNVNELEAMRQPDTPEPLSELVILETKQDLAAKIKAEHQSLMEAGRRTLEHALALGDLLNVAKVKVGHGNWLEWLARECPDVSERHARNFMAMAKERARIEAKSATVADLTIREALTLISTPDAEVLDSGAPIGPVGMTKPDGDPAKSTGEALAADAGPKPKPEPDRDGKPSTAAAERKPKAKQGAAKSKQGTAKSKSLPVAASKLTPEQKLSGDRTKLNKTWEPVLKVWGEACLPAQKGFVRKLAHDLNAEIHFAGIVAKPPKPSLNAHAMHGDPDGDSGEATGPRMSTPKQHGASVMQKAAAGQAGGEAAS